MGEGERTKSMHNDKFNLKCTLRFAIRNVDDNSIDTVAQKLFI